MRRTSAVLFVGGVVAVWFTVTLLGLRNTDADAAAAVELVVVADQITAQ